MFRIGIVFSEEEKKREPILSGMLDRICHDRISDHCHVDKPDVATLDYVSGFAQDLFLRQDRDHQERVLIVYLLHRDQTCVDETGVYETDEYLEMHLRACLIRMGNDFEVHRCTIAGALARSRVFKN